MLESGAKPAMLIQAGKWRRKSGDEDAQSTLESF
jgi:hypothetical protein